MHWYALSGVDVVGHLGTGSDGLTPADAVRRLAQHGPNALVELGP
ncbi:MAG: cation-transporting P-type ATPase [bacterium]